MIIGKKSIVFIISFILMIVLISNVIGVSIINYKPKYGIIADDVNFRSGVNSTFLKTVYKNSNVKMVGEIDDYYIVQLETNEVGVISKKFIKSSKIKPNTKDYTSISKYTANILNNSTNIRRGPSKFFTRVTGLNKGTKVTVIGKIDDFNLIVYSGNKIGMVDSSLISKVTNTNNIATPSNPPGTTTSNSDMVINYINAERTKRGISALKKDTRLMKIADLKSSDMVKNNYFSHTSPTYKSPFDMMKGFGIAYKAAGENLAGNSNIKSAIDSWLASPAHSKNMLSTAYNYVGTGVTKSDKYGFIIVAMFIGK